jgi:recombination protein RecT
MKPVGSISTLQGLLDNPKIRASVAGIIPTIMDPKRLLKMVLLAANRQPKLLQCTQASLLEATMTAAALGVDCSGTLGGGYLVPYGSQATFILGYRGLIDLARRGGDVQSITAHVVYKADKFKLVQGLEEKLEHEPNLDVVHKDEDIVGAYMIARFKSGGHHVEYMNIQEIMAIKKRSKAGDSGPWKSDFSEMVRKTVVRRGCKYLPLSIDAAQAIAQADEGLVDAWVPPVPETGSLSLEDFSEKVHEPTKPPLETEPIEPQPGLNDPPTELFNQGETPGWMGVRDLFKANCDAKSMADDQRSEAWDRMTEKCGFADWPELDTEAKCKTVRAWIHKMIPQPKEKV